MRHRKHNPAWEHIKLYIWVILTFELLLFGLALAVGRHTDYRFAFNVCLWLGLIVAVVFLSIFLLNLFGIATSSFFSSILNSVFRRRTADDRVPNIYDFPDLKKILQNADHVDIKTVEGAVRLPGFVAAMLSFRPDWLVWLYRIRKVFVYILGIKVDESQEILKPLSPGDIPFQPGDTVSFFTVRYAEEDRHWIAETPDDKHLQAYFGIFVENLGQQKNRFYVMTVVHYKHWTGPFYFNAIRPFHHLVVRQMAIAGVRIM